MPLNGPIVGRQHMEDSGAESGLNCGGLAPALSEKNINLWPRNCSWDTLVKNVSAFCPCQKSLPEVKVKRFGLILLIEGISKQLVLTLLYGY